MIEPKIVKDQFSTSYPVDKIRSYGCKFVITDTIKEVENGYMYDVQFFNNLQEYNQYLSQEKDKEIEQLKKEKTELEEKMENELQQINLSIVELLGLVLPEE